MSQASLGLLFMQPFPLETHGKLKRGVPAGSVCDECIALAMDEEQNEPAGDPQLAYLGAPAGMAAVYATTPLPLNN